MSLMNSGSWVRYLQLFHPNEYRQYLSDLSLATGRDLLSIQHMWFDWVKSYLLPPSTAKGA